MPVPRKTYKIQQIFNGTLLIGNKCGNCKNVTKRHENFMELSLSVPEENKNSNTLQELINYYFTPEILHGHNKYHCDNCGVFGTGIRTIKIKEAPEALILVIKNFRLVMTI